MIGSNGDAMKWVTGIFICVVVWVNCIVIVALTVFTGGLSMFWAVNLLIVGLGIITIPLVYCLNKIINS